jgi:hypothetical protein
MHKMKAENIIDKWCPFSRAICVGQEYVLFKKQGGCPTMFNRIQKGQAIHIPHACKCITDSCKAWKNDECKLIEK